MYVFIYLPSPEDMLTDFRVRGREREKEGEKYERKRLPFVGAPTGDLTLNPGMCTDQESNPQPLGLWDDPRPTEPHQPGLKIMPL